MTALIIICIAAFSILFYAVRRSETRKGRPYSIKDFLLELLNHTGDGSNFKR